jgi:hypothetical protein
LTCSTPRYVRCVCVYVSVYDVCVE